MTVLGARVRRLLVSVLVALVLPAPAAAPAAAQSTSEDLTEARQRLDESRRSVEQLDADLTRAQARLDEVDARLDAATDDLHTIEAELVVAEAARAEASAAAMLAGQRLETANSTLASSRDQVTERRRQLDRRVRGAYMHGADAGALLLEGIVQASSLHDMTTMARAVRRIAASDAALVDQAVQATRDEAEARIGVATAHAEHRALENAATRERDRVAALVARQQAVVATIATDRAERAAIVTQVSQDRAAAARLVQQLQEQVQRLAAQLADALLARDPTAGFDGDVPTWAAGLPARGRAWSPVIAGAAARHGVDARLFAALVWSESNFHPGALSHAGAIGLSQLMPATAAGLGVDPWDPVDNLLGGAQYLRIQLERFGATDLALAAYNAGPGRVESAGFAVPDIVETQLYVVRVLERFERLVAADG